MGCVEPGGKGGPGLVFRQGQRARHPVRGCVPDLRLCRGGAPDRQHHHRGTRPPWRRSVSPGGRVMRFRRWPRPTAYRETSRKRAAFLRKQRLEREALPLFAAQLDARPHGIDEEMRTEGRRGGKEWGRTCNSRGSSDPLKKNKQKP